MFKKKTENAAHKCAVHLLEDFNVVEYEFLEFHKGNYLLDQLSQQLNIKEKDYFGLRYLDTCKQRQWLDLGKLIIKQCKDVNPLIFSFRVKFYPADPFHLSANVRVLLYKQLKRDVSHGRLYCSIDEFITLASLIVQEEFGDYDANVHTDNYVSTLQFSVRQIDAIEKKIMNKHKGRKKGQDLNAVIDEFLGIARNLEAYGIEPHYVKDHQSCQIYIGVNFLGISTFVSGKRSQQFRWSEIRKLNYEGRMFIAHMGYTDASRELKKFTVGFKCTSGAACRYLWRSAIEHMLFFTLPRCGNAYVNCGGGIFSRGTKFKYTGRTEREILTDIITSNCPLETNGSENRKKANSMPATPSSPKGDLSNIRYNTLPRSKISDYWIPYSDDSGRENGYRVQSQMADEDSIYHNNFITNYCNPGLDNFAQNHIRQHVNNPTSKSSPLRNTSIGKNTNLYQNTIRHTKNLRKFHIMRSFFPSLIFVVVTMALSAFIILESQSELFDYIRNVPEIIVLRDEYYVPLRKFIKDMVIK
ncbi:FERM domain-containing protein 5 isoform X1 [Anastrepha obliqua]|uniref:FERM domain-containing protein 5 isoform X1 n=1 Tax=Anastrepha obliqua TaxID=95512 RepID=UPI002409A24D|nr:FERM domain-containing protein 5 isoform X1 [Anastrepha obliqua]